jgi:methyltransferase family protein
MRFNPLDFPIAFQYPQRCSPIVDWWGHVPFAGTLVAALLPARIVELGVYRGDSFNAFCQAVQTLGIKTECLGIDAWIGDENTGPQVEAEIKELFTFIETRYPFARLIKSLFDDAVGDIADASIDILHIDGCHRTEAVQNDLTRWLPKLRDKGIILLHDIAIGGSEACGVDIVWKALKLQYPDAWFEFAHSWGLGVFAPKGIPEALASFFASVGTPDEEKIQTYFQLQGARNYVSMLYRLHFGDALLLEGLNAGPLVSDPTQGIRSDAAAYTLSQ